MVAQLHIKIKQFMAPRQIEIDRLTDLNIIANSAQFNNYY